MEIKVEASTKLGHIATKQELELLGGAAGGMCYAEDLSALEGEPIEKTIKRSESTKARGHHSVFGHGFVTLRIINVPKLFAMLLNNEKIYNTSERSARYTKMIVSAEEQALYDKWHARLTQIIQDKYGNHPYFKPRIINNLARENARYFTSVMTPTNLDYTVSYQQLNYMCHWMEHFSEQENPLYQMLKPTADEFLNIVDSLGYLDPQMVDGKGRGFSLIAKRARQEQFGEVYSVNYLGSYAMLAQAHRTRPLSYEMMRTEDKHYFIPEFLKEYPELVEEWIQDMKTVADLVPQGELVQINERGNYENLIIKARERLCTAAQFETMHLTHQTMQKIAQNTDNEEVKKDLQQVMCGARCLTGYKCANPCGFKPGIDLSRTI